MSERYKAHAPNGLYYMTMTVVGRMDVFTRTAYSDIILDSLRFCQKSKGLILHGWVIMPNRLHLIGWVQEPHHMNATIRDFKKFTARQILLAIENSTTESRREWLLHQFQYNGFQHTNWEKYQFWKDGFHPIQLWSPGVIEQKLKYLHYNPVRAGKVLTAIKRLMAANVRQWSIRLAMSGKHKFM